MLRIRFAVALLAGALLVGGTATGAEPAAAKVITPDAKGFVHVRVGDIWNADVTKQLRDFLAHAGPGLINEFDTRFVPQPSDMESFTVILFDMKFRDILPTGRPTDLTPVWVVTSKKPIDRDALLKTMAKSGKPRKHNGKEYYFDETYWSGLLILDDRSYAYASEDSITSVIDRMAKGGDSPLAALLTREADKHPATLGVNVPGVATPAMVKEVPPEIQPLFKAKTLLATLDLKPKTLASAALEFGSEAEAKDGMKAVQEAVQLGRGQIGNALTFVEQKAKGEPGKKVGIQEFPEAVGFLLAAAGLKQLDALLGAMPLEQKGNSVQAALELDKLLPGGSTAVSIMAVAGAIMAAMEMSGPIGGPNLQPGNYDWTERERNLAGLARAIENYRKDKGHYPPPAILDKDGKPILSWRVAILPYMENAWINNNGGPGEKPINNPKDLYNLFKMDEPWDGPNNKKLLDKLPSLYRAPWSVLRYNQSSIGKTTTLAVVGKGAIFDPTKKTVNDNDVRDSLKHTLLLLQVEESNQAVYWTKPADITLTAEGKLPADGPNINKRFAVVYADGSSHTLVNGLAEKVFLGIVTREGNEKLDEKVIRPEPIKGKGGFIDDPIPPPPPVLLKN